VGRPRPARGVAAGRGDQGDLLPDEAADRETEQIDSLQAERVDEGDRVAGHRLDGAWRPAGRGADANVVERNHASIRRECVGERGVPVVEVAAEVLQQDQRHLAFAEVTVRVIDRILGCDSFDRGIGIAALLVGRRLFVCDCHERSFQRRTASAARSGT
jgi:hypothetical protein